MDDTTNYTTNYTTWVWPCPSGAVPTRDLFDVEVYGANKLTLIPRTELAKSLLGMWLHGECKRSLRLSGLMNGKGSYGRDVDAMDMEFSTRPLLATGDDPYFTGLTLNPEEAAACRKLVDDMRTAKQLKPRKRARRKRT